MFPCTNIEVFVNKLIAIPSFELRLSSFSSSKKALKSTPPMEIDEEEDDSEPPIFYVTTGYNLKPAQETALNKLGATFQDQFDKNTNLLIAGGKISRTEKFLRALAKGDVAIVDGKWVEDVVKSKQIKRE